MWVSSIWKRSWEREREREWEGERERKPEQTIKTTTTQQPRRQGRGEDHLFYFFKKKFPGSLFSRATKAFASTNINPCWRRANCWQAVRVSWTRHTLLSFFCWRKIHVCIIFHIIYHILFVLPPPIMQSCSVRHAQCSWSGRGSRRGASQGCRLLCHCWSGIEQLFWTILISVCVCVCVCVCVFVKCDNNSAAFLDNLNFLCVCVCVCFCKMWQ